MKSTILFTITQHERTETIELAKNSLRSSFAKKVAASAEIEVKEKESFCGRQNFEASITGFFIPESRLTEVLQYCKTHSISTQDAINLLNILKK